MPKATASWNDLPFEVKSVILEHHIRYTMVAALPRMRHKHWVSDKLPADTLRRLAKIVPEMQFEVIKLTQKVKIELDQAVKEYTKALFVEYAEEEWWYSTIKAEGMRSQEALAELQKITEAWYSGWSRRTRVFGQGLRGACSARRGGFNGAECE